MDGELLKQALLLTLVGMGMTFTAIGALVLGMVALGAIKPKAVEAEEDVEAPVASTEAEIPAADARYLAAAAAVSVACAQAVRESRQPAGAPVDQWRGYVRNQNLAQRARQTQGLRR